MPTVQLYPDSFYVRPPKPQRPRRKNPRCVTVPNGVSAHVRLVFEEIARQMLTYDTVAEISGFQRASLKAWRRKNAPGLGSLEAVLGALGFAFVPTPALEVLPPELAGEITALAIKFGQNIPQTWSALVDIGVEQKLLRMDADERRAVLAARKATNDNVPRLRRANGA